MAPLLLFYEFGAATAASSGAALRNTSELFLSQLIEIAGGGPTWRYAIIGFILLVAAVKALHEGLALGEGVLWSILEGTGLGILLGPVMLILLDGVLDWLPSAELASGGNPDPGRVGLVFGGAAWEELLFRFVLLAALYQIGRWLFGFLDREESERSRWPAEVLALVLSSLAFAAAHLDVVVGWLGVGGEAYNFDLFAWRAFAGLMFGVIARSRGLGVAAWTHALFNFSLVFGSGPGVFLLAPG